VGLVRVRVKFRDRVKVGVRVVVRLRDSLDRVGLG